MRVVHLKFSIMLMVAVTLLSACFTFGEEKSDVDNYGGPEINLKTILPTKYKTQMSSKQSTKPMVISAGLLNISRVSRPRAEVREGPGVQFAVVDLMIKKGDRVVVYDRVGVWQKIILLQNWKKGWVHNKVLTKAKPNGEAITATPNVLPTVFAQRPIRTVYKYPKHEKIKTLVPTGAIFKSLKHSRRRTLVWQADTNSLMWLSRKDVR